MLDRGQPLRGQPQRPTGGILQGRPIVHADRGLGAIGVLVPGQLDGDFGPVGRRVDKQTVLSPGGAQLPAAGTDTVSVSRPEEGLTIARDRKEAEAQAERAEHRTEKRFPSHEIAGGLAGHEAGI